MTYTIVHAHCYQPPREDPWLEVVEAEPSAAPDHDWNARIDRECYARLGAVELRARDPRVAARDPDARGGLARIVNLYGWCTFDVGATLCEWLETEAPGTLAAMVAGDGASIRRWGHGNAIAAPYHHVILPLASQRDRETEVRWGIADFVRRFGRPPEGMWLPECAVDEDTLDTIAAAGIRFTILAPYQVRTDGDHRGMPVRWRGARGRELAIVPYDGNLAGEVAFGGLLRNAPALAARLRGGNDHGDEAGARCITLATDGETFGHHHRGGDATLAEAMRGLVRADLRRDGGLLNAAALVAMHPPTHDATLVSPSAWSCAHGVERWRSNCGCRLDGSRPPAQQWRGPLRQALTRLADECHVTFAEEGARLFNVDPWQARDEYGAVVALDGDTLRDFVTSRLRAELRDGDARDAALHRGSELLEMARAVLRTFTSCAWFFDDVERIETRQVLRYAARALELSGRSARLEPELVRWLAPAVGSNSPGSASDLFVREALPRRDPALSVAAAAAALAEHGSPADRIAAYDVTAARVDGTPSWRVLVRHRRTGAERRVRAIVEGRGPSLAVSLVDDSTAAHDRISIGDFPESAARALLLDGTNDDDALLAAS